MRLPPHITDKTFKIVSSAYLHIKSTTVPMICHHKGAQFVNPKWEALVDEHFGFKLAESNLSIDDLLAITRIVDDVIEAIKEEVIKETLQWGIH